MHDTAYSIGVKFIELYAPPEIFTVVEVGSQDVNGTLRRALPQRATYFGIDAEPGRNVDIVATGSALPLATATADITIASSVIEHDPTFWQTFLELCRVTKTGGYIYLSAPSNGAVHRYPRDCWRFYPDAGDALAEWGRRNGQDATLIESFTADRLNDLWNDFVAVFFRGPQAPTRTDHFLHAAFRARNIRQLGTEALLNPRGPTEDQDLLGTAATALLALEHRATAANSDTKINGPTDEHTRKMKNLMSARLGPPIEGEAIDPGTLIAPFDASYRIIDNSISALSTRFERYKASARQREDGLRRRLRKAEDALAKVRGALKPETITLSDYVWYSVDQLEPTTVTGWAMLAAEPDKHLHIDILAGDKCVASSVADRPRAHLAHQGYGSGRFGFHFNIGARADIARTGLRIVARWDQGQVELGRLAPSATGA